LDLRQHVFRAGREWLAAPSTLNGRLDVDIDGAKRLGHVAELRKILANAGEKRGVNWLDSLIRAD
jgi:hypothetical protein